MLSQLFTVKCDMRWRVGLLILSEVSEQLLRNGSDELEGYWHKDSWML